MNGRPRRTLCAAWKRRGPKPPNGPDEPFRSPGASARTIPSRTAVVGLLAQLRAPSKNVAGQLMAVMPWAALSLIVPLTNYWVNRGTWFVIVATTVFGTLTLVATILHPTGRDLFSSFHVSRVSRVMLALVVLAAVPLLAMASTNIGLQRTATNDHAALGHYGFMAAFGITVIGVGLLASLRPRGWRLTA